jgi:hypothetical protein
MVVGEILLAIGIFQNPRWLQTLLRAWPIVLILIGVSFLIRVVRGNPTGHGGAHDQSVSESSSPVSKATGNKTDAAK